MTVTSPPPSTPEGYAAAVVDILGALAYAELSAFSQLAADANMAPTHQLKADVSALAVAEFLKYEALDERLISLGSSADEAMTPFTAAFDGFHKRTQPSDFLEGLVKAYVGDGIAQDFYREIATFLDPDTRDFVLTVLAARPAKREFIVGAVRSAIDDDPRRGGRLALWGRRLVGEAITQAQGVIVERDALSAILVGGIDGVGADLAEIGRMFARITDNHTKRMERLGLSA